MINSASGTIATGQLVHNKGLRREEGGVLFYLYYIFIIYILLVSRFIETSKHTKL